MQWSSIEEFFPQIATIITIVGGAIGLLSYIQRRIARWWQQSRSSSSEALGIVQRPQADSYRRPLLRPSRPLGTLSSEDLVKSIRCEVRVPLEYWRHSGRLLNFWRRMKLEFFTLQTSPKPSFTVSGWRYDMGSSHLVDDIRRCSGGFLLHMTLHRNENAQHFRRSLRAGKSNVCSKRVVAIASAEDFVRPTAWVRCLVVNAYSLNLAIDSFQEVVVRSSDPLLVDGPIVFRLRRRYVPDSAIWIITMNPNHIEPSSSWGQSPERLETHASPPESALHDGEKYRYDELIERQGRYAYIAKLAFLVLLGPIMALLIAGIAVLMPGAPSEVAARVVVTVSAPWFVVSTYGIVIYSVYLAVESLRGYRWCHSGRTLRVWKGGTVDCLLFGGLLRRGPILRRRDWKRYWQSVDSSF